MQKPFYYDRVLVQPTNEPQFAEFVAWFVSQGRFADLLDLIKDKTIGIYCYSFVSAPVLIEHTGRYDVINIEDREAANSCIFESRYLSCANLKEALPKAGDRDKLLTALQDAVIEVKAEASSYFYLVATP